MSDIDVICVCICTSNRLELYSEGTAASNLSTFVAGVVEEAATAPRAEPACPSSSLRCIVSVVRISEAYEG